MYCGDRTGGGRETSMLHRYLALVQQLQHKVRNSPYRNLVIWSFLCLFLGIFMRVYGFVTIPHGLTWDEAAIGYNGFAVWTTRRDEWLQFLPVSFRSFGDFKAPLAIYIVGGFTQVFGLTPLAVRLPFLLASFVALIAMGKLSWEVAQKLKVPAMYGLAVAFSATALLATSSWHIHFSRIGMESGISLSFLLIGLSVLLHLTRTETVRVTIGALSKLVFSITCLALSVYAYHSAKIVVPAVLVLVALLLWQQARAQWKLWLSAAVAWVVLLLPLLYDAVFGAGLTRANTLIVGQQGGTQLLGTLFEQFLLHLSPQFLLAGSVTSLRHGTGYLGVLYVTTIIFAVAGVVWLVKSFAGVDAMITRLRRQTAVFLGGWFVIGLIPAALGAEVPHSNRALLALPGILLLAAFGVVALYEYCVVHARNGRWFHHGAVARACAYALLVIHIGFTLSFFEHYVRVFSRASAADFKDGYLEAFAITRMYDKGLDGHEPVEKILFTDDYGQPYIYGLFVGKTNPIWYQGGSLNKYEFSGKVDSGDLFRKNTVVVASETDEMGTQEPEYVILGSDGRPKFRIYVTER